MTDERADEQAESSEELTSGEVEASAEATPDPYAELRDILTSHQPELTEVDFNPVEETGKVLAAYEALVNEQSVWLAEAQDSLRVLEARASQKDVRDERVDAVVRILKDKLSDTAKVAKLERLLLG